MAEWYVIVGIDPKGQRHEVARATSALSARIYRDAKRNPWVRTEIYGEGRLLSEEDLDRLADAARSSQTNGSSLSQA